MQHVIQPQKALTAHALESDFQRGSVAMHFFGRHAAVTSGRGVGAEEFVLGGDDVFDGGGVLGLLQRKVAITLSDTFVVARWRAELLDFITQSADIVLANEAELGALFETEDFDVAAAKLAAIVEIAAVTRGEHGSVVIKGDERVVVAAYPVAKVIDTTGAGDQYAAGFLLGLARGLTLEEAGKLGSLAASEVIAHWGPRPMVKLVDLAKENGLKL